MTPHRFALTLALMLALLYSTQWHALTFLPEPSTTIPLGEQIARTTFRGDSAAYMQMVDDPASVGAPYRYRVLPVLLVRLTGLPTVVGYLLLNALCFLFVGVGFTWYLLRWFAYPTALIGGLLAVTTAGLQRTVLYPSVDPATYAAALAVFWVLPTRRVWLFALVAALAVLTKEVFIAAVPVYLAHHTDPGLFRRAIGTGRADA